MSQGSFVSMNDLGAHLSDTWGNVFEASGFSQNDTFQSDFGSFLDDLVHPTQNTANLNLNESGDETESKTFEFESRKELEQCERSNVDQPPNSLMAASQPMEQKDNMLNDIVPPQPSIAASQPLQTDNILNYRQSAESQDNNNNNNNNNNAPSEANRSNNDLRVSNESMHQTEENANSLNNQPRDQRYNRQPSTVNQRQAFDRSVRDGNAQPRVRALNQRSINQISQIMSHVSNWTTLHNFGNEIKAVSNQLSAANAKLGREIAAAMTAESNRVIETMRNETNRMMESHERLLMSMGRIFERSKVDQESNDKEEIEDV